MTNTLQPQSRSTPACDPIAHRGVPARHRRGFTLIELLVVITIMLIIMSMTISAVIFVRESDRVSGAAGQFQSFLAGARDRAIYSKEPRGVRLFIEPAPPGSSSAGAESRTISAMAYIAPGGTWGAPKNSSGIDIMRIDGNIFDEDPKRAGISGVDADGDFEDAADLLIKIRGSNNPGWWNLKRRGWLTDGLRMRIPSGPTGNWYTIRTGLIDTSVAPTDDQYLILDIPYADGGNAGQQIAFQNLTYEIELPARILPQDPLLFPDGVVLDLDGSNVPDIWRPASTGNSLYSGFMDVVFSPRGNVIGDAAAKGVLHFYICDSEDSLFLKEQIVSSVGLPAFDVIVGSGSPFVPTDEIDPAVVSWLTWEGKYIVKDRRIVTLFAQTGAISVHGVNAYVGNTGGSNPDANNDGIADDPFRFAETGEVAK
ncbi:MAG: prepilin-type N-terminal cleavage/methylation domain-containing protein [Fuerstiella sp.]